MGGRLCITNHWSPTPEGAAQFGVRLDYKNIVFFNHKIPAFVNVFLYGGGAMAKSEEIAVLNDALYYPYINLPNDSWLRTAVLFWDTINPIVPSSIYHKMDSESLLKILERNGAATAVYPDECASGDKADVLTESILNYAEHYKESISEKSLLESYSKIHTHKMPWRLIDELKKMDLLKELPDDYDWYYLYKPIGDIFMGELARILANQNEMIPISDNENSSSHIFGQPLLKGESKGPLNFLYKLFKSSNNKKLNDDNLINTRRIAVKFLVKNVLPTPSSEFDIETLLRIKEDNKKFLYKFRNSFRTTISEVRTASNKDIVLEGLQKFDDSIKADLEKIKDLFAQYEKDIQLSDMGAILSIDKPIKSLGKIGLTTAGLAISPAFFIGLVLFVGYDVIKGRNQLKKDLEKSISDCPGAYIYKLREDLSKYRNSGYNNQ